MASVGTRRKRYRQRRLEERLYRWLGGWKSTGNTLSPLVNRRYRRYAEACRDRFSSSGNPAIDVARSSLRREGVGTADAALPEEVATAQSRTFSRQIELGDGIVRPPGLGEFLVILKRPLDAFGTRLLDLFEGPIHETLTGYFGGHYRIEWLDCYRTYPTRQPRASWLWHIDNVPSECIKVLLHLTPGGAHEGRTEYLSREQTFWLHRAGYFGVYNDERLADLSGLSASDGPDIAPLSHDTRPGDILIFDNNLLHRGVPPESAHRDVMTFLLLPNPIPWQEQLQRDGLDAIQDQPGGFPSDPKPRI